MPPLPFLNFNIPGVDCNDCGAEDQEEISYGDIRDGDDVNAALECMTAGDAVASSPELYHGMCFIVQLQILTHTV